MYNFLTVTHRRLDIFRIFKKTKNQYYYECNISTT